MSQKPTSLNSTEDKWWLDAKCRGMPAELFVPDSRGGSTDRFEKIKDICWGRDGKPECPVRQECKQAGEDENELGIWGGEMRSTRDYLGQLKSVSVILTDARPKRA